MERGTSTAIGKAISKQGNPPDSRKPGLPQYDPYYHNEVTRAPRAGRAALGEEPKREEKQTAQKEGHDNGKRSEGRKRATKKRGATAKEGRAEKPRRVRRTRNALMILSHILSSTIPLRAPAHPLGVASADPRCLWLSWCGVAEYVNGRS